MLLPSLTLYYLTASAYVYLPHPNGAQAVAPFRQLEPSRRWNFHQTPPSPHHLPNTADTSRRHRLSSPYNTPSPSTKRHGHDTRSADLPPYKTPPATSQNSTHGGIAAPTGRPSPSGRRIQYRALRRLNISIYKLRSGRCAAPTKSLAKLRTISYTDELSSPMLACSPVTTGLPQSERYISLCTNAIFFRATKCRFTDQKPLATMRTKFPMCKVFLSKLTQSLHPGTLSSIQFTFFKYCTYHIATIAPLYCANLVLLHVNTHTRLAAHHQHRRKASRTYPTLLITHLLRRHLRQHHYTASTAKLLQQQAQDPRTSKDTATQPVDCRTSSRRLDEPQSLLYPTRHRFKAKIMLTIYMSGTVPHSNLRDQSRVHSRKPSLHHTVHLCTGIRPQTAQKQNKARVNRRETSRATGALLFVILPAPITPHIGR
ncbi:hypothetical protein BBAD15_g12480 [Beauveria bassiana D1-5]|uniref:Uncharacterized protein n=1 Tax=Beauveria bassiana D1-5 TaxID=1245745 RepID=A0A0A2V3F7_BEABA|nr:hypothetical protein BBAD15_g12480 [Beauveria bassiana D1-5]